MELAVISIFHYRRPYGEIKLGTFDPKLNVLTNGPRIHIEIHLSISLLYYRELYHSVFRVVFHASNGILHAPSLHPIHRVGIFKLDNILHGTYGCW